MRRALSLFATVVALTGRDREVRDFQSVLDPAGPQAERVAAPLALLAHPLPVILRGMPAAVRHRAPRLIRSRLMHCVTHPEALLA